MNNAWEGTIEMPVSDRSIKPRSTGLTMVIDKGMGIHRLEDLIRSASEYIDIIKLTFGTSAFYEKEFLKEKNAIITSADIDVMPGGTFFEIAIWQNKFKKYLNRAKELGFSAIEISDGTIEMDLETRKNAITMACDCGFKVITEVGKKDPKEAIPLSQVHQLIEEDLSNGSVKVIIEAREAGKGVGIFDAEGKIKDDEVEGIIAGVENLNDIMWEAPIKNQQQALIIRCGTNVNLGNIPPDEILALEALRQGVRGDTLKRAYLDNKDWSI
ncbi:MAG: phosphosulfolactate synthase [Candidatus Aminicenantes bacterium]|nr:phosphosulfolactate synthase [Candidatus Aminicenantes bacterium]